MQRNYYLIRVCPGLFWDTQSTFAELKHPNINKDQNSLLLTEEAGKQSHDRHCYCSVCFGDTTVKRNEDGNHNNDDTVDYERNRRKGFFKK